MASIPQQTLPNDILFDILTRVPLDDLSTCRQTNREIYSTTKDPTFKPRHCVKTSTTSGYLIQRSRYSPDVSSYFFASEYPVNCPVESLPVLKNRHTTIEAVSQCRGLICCFNGDYGKKQYYVCKPATGQCRAIPNPNMRFETAAAAMVANTTGSVEFKIIRFTEPTNSKIHRTCEIFDSRSWTWRRSIKIKKRIFFFSHCFARDFGGVFVCGSVYWLVKDSKSNLCIFAFDVNKESWQLIQLPSTHTDFENWWHSKITVRDGKLCYVIVKDAKEVNVWTVERYGQKTWWRKDKVNFKEEDNMKETWLELYTEFVYSSRFSRTIGFFSDIWEKFWMEKLNKFGVKDFFVGDTFRIESDFTHCECLE